MLHENARMLHAIARVLHAIEFGQAAISNTVRLAIGAITTGWLTS